MTLDDVFYYRFKLLSMIALLSNPGAPSNHNVIVRADAMGFVSLDFDAVDTSWRKKVKDKSDQKVLRANVHSFLKTGQDALANCLEWEIEKMEAQ